MSRVKKLKKPVWIKNLNNVRVVYGHYLPGEDLPFYVGSGTYKRAYFFRARHKDWYKVVFLENNGNDPQVRILCITDADTWEGFRVEYELIKRWQPRANIKGTPRDSGSVRKARWDSDYRAQHGAAMKAKWTPELRAKASAESKDRLRKVA